MELSYSPRIIYLNGVCARPQRSNRQVFIRLLLVYLAYTFVKLHVQSNTRKLRIKYFQKIHTHFKYYLGDRYVDICSFLTM